MTRSALVIGAGGLGCPAALALAAAGVRRIGLVDDDRVDATNLHRQVLFTATRDVGDARRSTSLARALARRFPALDVDRHAGPLRRRQRRASCARGYDVVVDGSDNFATKFLANDAAVLAGRPLVHGAAVGAGRPAAHRAPGRPPLLPLPVRGAARRRGSAPRAPRPACWGRSRA